VPIHKVSRRQDQQVAQQANPEEQTQATVAQTAWALQTLHRKAGRVRVVEVAETCRRRDLVGDRDEMGMFLMTLSKVLVWESEAARVPRN
jgi:hypothetical protein